MAYDKVMLPRGLEVAIQTDPATPDVYTDLGLIYNDGSIEFSYDQPEWTSSQGEKIKSFIQNMQITASFDLAQMKLENIDKLMSGASAYTTVAGTLVTGHVQTLTASSWAREVFIPFDKKQAAGTAPASLVVTNPGSLVLGTDYIVTQSGEDWGVIVLATRGNLANNLVFTYNYTPAASKKISLGSNSVEIVPRALRIRQNQGTSAAPQYLTAVIYSAINQGGLSLTFSRFDSDAPQLVPITMVGRIDPTRTDLDQLFSFEDATA